MDEDGRVVYLSSFSKILAPGLRTAFVIGPEAILAKLEILKQLYLGSRIVILDEPTSVLTPDEADSVLGMLREMAHAREISVLMITHKFREVTRFCDEVTVLRQGRRTGAGFKS